MRRFLIFAALFQLLTFVVGFRGMLQVMNWAVGERGTADYHQVILLPIACVMAIVPALLMALANDMLAQRNVR